jgi:hypothetical protein
MTQGNSTTACSLCGRPTRAQMGVCSRPSCIVAYRRAHFCLPPLTVKLCDCGDLFYQGKGGRGDARSCSDRCSSRVRKRRERRLRAEAAAALAG